MATGAIIAYVPDGTYQTSVLDSHCTLGFFGPAKDLEPWQIAVMKGIASDLAEFKPYYLKKPRISGAGVFVLDPSKDDGYTHAYVSLVDWNGFPYARKLIEEKAGFVDRRHGFTPHMTRSFATSWQPELMIPEPVTVFQWASVDVWLGDERVSFPIDTTEDDS
jgi:hypothetical protein